MNRLSEIFEGIMLTIHQREDKGNRMASAPHSETRHPFPGRQWQEFALVMLSRGRPPSSVELRIGNTSIPRTDPFQTPFRFLGDRFCSRSLLAIFFIAASSQLRAKGVEFQVSGQIEQQTYLGVQGIETAAFEVFVRDDDWLIKIHQLSFPSAYSNAMLLDYSCFNKGDSIYTFAHARDYNTILDRLLADPTAPADWKAHPEHVAFDMAWIEKSDVPHADARFALPMIFYAYCSQKYLTKPNGNRMEPPFFVDGRPYSFDEGVTNVSVYFNRCETPPFLPEQISFMHGDNRLLGPRAMISLPKEWESFTNAVFNVNEFTNVGNLKLPASFTLTIFFATQSKKGEPLAITTNTRLFAHAKVMSERCEVSSQDMKPAMQASAHVTDKRLHLHGNPLRVRYDTNTWLSEEAVLQLPQYSAAILESQAQDAVPKSRNRTARFFVLGFLIFLTFPFVSYLVRRKTKQTKQTKE